MWWWPGLDLNFRHLQVRVLLLRVLLVQVLLVRVLLVRAFLVRDLQVRVLLLRVLLVRVLLLRVLLVQVLLLRVLLVQFLLLLVLLVRVLLLRVLLVQVLLLRVLLVQVLLLRVLLVQVLLLRVLLVLLVHLVLDHMSRFHQAQAQTLQLTIVLISFCLETYRIRNNQTSCNSNSLHMFMVIGSTCLLLDLLAVTSRQYFLLMIYHITIVLLLICVCKFGQEKNTHFD